MSNTIQIKRGSGKPANGKLAQGELGFDTTNGYLYIGNEGICQKIKAGSADSVKEANLEFGGKHFANNFSPIDAALIPELGANRFAFIQQGVTVERKKGNNNWEDVTSNYPNEIKQIFSTNNGRILLRDDQVANETSFSLRITIDTTAANIYTELHKFAIHISTSGTRSCSCLISISTTGETWQTPGGATPFSITGWPGWNILNTALFLTKGNTAASGRFQFIRFEFSGVEPANNSNTGLRIIGIMAFGGMGWSTPSTMASTGRIYSFDYNKNVSFPAQVTASKFIGTATNATNADNLTTTLLLNKGGTGSAAGLNNASHGAVIIKNSGGYLAPVSTASGALYATAAEEAPKFGVLPLAQGGTGSQTYLANAKHGAVIVKNSGGYLYPSDSKAGAFYSTGTDAMPVFGLLPLAYLANLTASKALVSNSEGKITASNITSTELGYLDGVTSNIQKQINNKKPQFVLLAKEKDVSGTSSFTITDVGSYVGFTFLGYTAGGDATDGWVSITIPKDFIVGDYGQTAKTRRLVMGHANDSKSFTVKIDDNNTMTVTGVSGGGIGSGLKENLIYVYGIK